jgi:hypothetical protein
MPLLERKKQFVAKVEGTKGSAETLAAADYMAVENLKFNFSPTMIERNPYRSYLSPEAMIPGPQLCTVSFRMEFKGCGTAATCPPVFTLLRGCGGKISGTVSSIITADSDDADTSTFSMGVWNDGVLQLMYGARGNCVLEFGANAISWANFTFTGIYTSTTDVVAYANVAELTTLPVPAKNVGMTLNFGVSWATVALTKFTLDLGNTVVVRENMNATTGLSYAMITKKAPKGTMDPEKVTVATQDFWSFLRTPTRGAVAFTVGSATGNTMAVSLPKVQVTSIGDGGDNDVARLDLAYQLTANAGDDEWVFTQT